MKYLDEFRNPTLIKKLADKISSISRRRIKLMEICGGHTMVINKYRLEDILPSNIELISGPGCPVCVTSIKDIDRAIASCNIKNSIITTFGDLFSVPGTYSSLEKEKADGKDIRIIYSQMDVLELSRKNINKEVIFVAIGFETTAPNTALIIKKAKEESLKNISILSLHKTIPPAMEALLTDKKRNLDGFICPGHVTAIIGSRSYKFITDEFKIPCVVSGFEPLDLLEAIYLLVKQIENGIALVENAYPRVVNEEGNMKAQNLMNEAFGHIDANWRGLGEIPLSGLGIGDEFEEFDAQNKFDIRVGFESKENPMCKCSEILLGNIRPYQCPLFGTECSPLNPKGACMVSSEGACAAYYKYGTKIKK